MILLLRFLRTSSSIISLGCPDMLKCSQILQLSNCLYWYDILNSCKYLKSESHLPNAQVNKASSVNKEIVKTCLIMDMVRKNWPWIAVAGCGLHYFFLALFGLFWVVVNFSGEEKFKYLFFTAMKNHTIKPIVKKQNNSIFSSLVT